MACPICDKDADPKYRPFCSARCSNIDLGKWLTGAYAVPSEREDDADELAEALYDEAQKPH